MKSYFIFALLIFLSFNKRLYCQEFFSFFNWPNGQLTATNWRSDPDPIQFGAYTGCLYADISISNSAAAWQTSNPRYAYSAMGMPASAGYGMRLGVDWANTSQVVTYTITFKSSSGGPVTEYPVEFSLYDINAHVCGATSANRFIDAVSVVGYRQNLSTVVNPSYANAANSGGTTCTANAVTGNWIKGSGNCALNRTNVTFSANVARIVITYTTGLGHPAALDCGTNPAALVAGNDPRAQEIAFSPFRINTNAAPSSVSGITNICSGTTTTLTAVGGNASTRWYTGSCGGTQIGTGVNITVAPTANTTYFVANPNLCGITSCATASVTVYGSTPSTVGIAANDYLWVSSASPTITIDSEGDPNCTLVGFGSGSSTGGWHNGTARFNSGTAGAHTASALYTPNIPQTSSYDVYFSVVRGGNRAPDVPFVITHAGGTTTLSIDQTGTGFTWTYLGTFTFNAGTSGSVSIRNGPMAAATATRLAMADAIRFVKVGGSTDYELASNWLQYNGTTFSPVTSPPFTSNNVHIRPIGGCITEQPTVDNAITTADAVGSANANNITIASGATLNFSTNNSHLHINGNYLNQGTVNPGTGRIKFIRNGTQTITDASGTATFYEMNVAGTSTVALSSSVTVTNAIRLNGVITTGTNRVYLNTTAVDGASTGFVNYTGHIFGNLRRRVVSNTNNYFFPVGVSNVLNTGRRLLEWMNNNTTGITDLDCSVSNTFKGSGNNVDAQLDIANKAKSFAQVMDIVRPEAEWTLTPTTAITGGNYGLRLYLQNFAALPDNQFTIMKRPDASTTFFDFNTFFATTTIPALNAAGRIYSSGTGYAQKTGFTAFSKFVVATSAQVLPIELINYNITCAKNKAVLNWQTASETNNHYFTIWRSNDGANFDSLAFVYGAGNNNQVNTYTWTDNFQNDLSPNAYYYYKISQTDFSGEKTFFSAKFFDKSCGLGIFPNPIFDKGTLIFYLNGTSKVSGTLYNALGQLVRNYFIDQSFENGSHLYELNMSGISSGIYYLNVTINNEISTLKISVQKE